LQDERRSPRDWELAVSVVAPRCLSRRLNALETSAIRNALARDTSRRQPCDIVQHSSNALAKADEGERAPAREPVSRFRANPDGQAAYCRVDRTVNEYPCSVVYRNEIVLPDSRASVIAAIGTPVLLVNEMTSPETV
jgi:hypothetical protein